MHGTTMKTTDEIIALLEKSQITTITKVLSSYHRLTIVLQTQRFRIVEYRPRVVLKYQQKSVEKFPRLNFRPEIRMQGVRKVHPRTAHKIPEGKQLCLHCSFNLGARWKGWPTPSCGRFIPENRPGTHCMGGWVSTKARLDGCEKIRSHRDLITGPSIPYRVARVRKLTLYLNVRADIQLITRPLQNWELIYLVLTWKPLRCPYKFPIPSCTRPSPSSVMYVFFKQEPSRYVSLEYSRVRSVKTQPIYCQITNVATCFDSQSHHQANLEPYQFRYINTLRTGDADLRF